MSRPGLASTRGDSDELETGAPEPLEHAAPDVELAEAQMAQGRPELEPEPGGQDESESVDEFELEAYGDADPIGGVESDLGQALGGGGVRPPRRQRGAPDDGGADDSSGFGGELEEAEAPVPAARAHVWSRLLGFLQGSWRELQRVQWPDRRQVMQATGVVLGFVVVAGVFLGAADALAQRVVNLIITGQFK